MNQDQVYAELTKIFRDVFQDDSIFVIASTTAEDVTGWDSSAHVNLILAIEMQLGVVFNTSEIDEMQSVGDLAEALERKLK